MVFYIFEKLGLVSCVKMGNATFHYVKLKNEKILLNRELVQINYSHLFKKNTLSMNFIKKGKSLLIWELDKKVFNPIPETYLLSTVLGSGLHLLHMENQSHLLIVKDMLVNELSKASFSPYELQIFKYKYESEIKEYSKRESEDLLVKAKNEFSFLNMMTFIKNSFSHKSHLKKWALFTVKPLLLSSVLVALFTYWSSHRTTKEYEIVLEAYQKQKSGMRLLNEKVDAIEEGKALTLTLKKILEEKSSLLFVQDILNCINKEEMVTLLKVQKDRFELNAEVQSSVRLVQCLNKIDVFSEIKIVENIQKSVIIEGKINE